MSITNLSSLDLNLLVVLDALLTDPNVTRVGRRLGRSQPSVSRALAELRGWFGAPLFVRTRYGLVPTVGAETLRDGVRDVLARVSGLLAPVPRFEPSTSRQRFRLATAEYAQCLMLPRLVARLAEVAPGLCVDVVPWSANGLVAALESGGIDLAIAPAVQRAPHVRIGGLFSDTFVTVHRADHALAHRPLTRTAFAAAKHLQVAPDGREGSVVDDALARVRLKRDVVLRVPSFAVVPLLVTSSDLIATIPARLAAQFGASWPLTTRVTPLRLPSFKLCMLWHERTHEDPALSWLRRELGRLIARDRSAEGRAARIHLERRARGSL